MTGEAASPIHHQAIMNNARWCDGMCRAHGVPGEFHQVAWINRQVVPPFHSNVISLTGPQDAQAQRSIIESLINADPDVCGGVKDSFACLDLGDLGFQVLFEASWIVRIPTLASPADDDGLAWHVADNDVTLADWERAWRGDDVNAGTAEPRLFRPVLLRDPDVAFFAARVGGTSGPIVAVAIANRTERVVGLSNVFAPGESSGSHWRGCVRSVRERFPGLPIVGYERGGDLEAARSVGFEPIHPLRVWVRSPTYSSAST